MNNLIGNYISWIIESDENVKNTTQAVGKIAEIAAVSIRTAWSWVRNERDISRPSLMLLKFYAEKNGKEFDKLQE